MGDHQKTLNDKIEKNNKRLYQNDSKLSYNWFPLDADMFSKESKDFLNSTTIEEMNHLDARNELIEKIEKNEKPMVSQKNDTPQLLDAEKLANESSDVKVTK